MLKYIIISLWKDFDKEKYDMTMELLKSGYSVKDAYNNVKKH